MDDQQASKFTLPTRHELKRQLASDEQSKVIAGLLAVTKSLGDRELYDDVVLLSSQFERCKREQRLGSTDFDRLIIIRTRIGRSLLDVINQLPQDIAAKIASGSKTTNRFKGIYEGRLKKQVLILTLGVKILLILNILHFAPWQAGGITKSEILPTILLLMPVLSIYLTVMIPEYTKRRNELASTFILKKRVTRGFQLFIYIVFLVYALIALWVIGMKPRGVLSYEEIITWIALIEIGFGMFMGEVIFGLFKRKI